MPMAWYGDAPRHAAIASTDGVSQVSNACIAPSPGAATAVVGLASTRPAAITAALPRAAADATSARKDDMQAPPGAMRPFATGGRPARERVPVAGAGRQTHPRGHAP